MASHIPHEGTYDDWLKDKIQKYFEVEGYDVYIEMTDRRGTEPDLGVLVKMFLMQSTKMLMITMQMGITEKP